MNRFHILVELKLIKNFLALTRLQQYERKNSFLGNHGRYLKNKVTGTDMVKKIILFASHRPSETKLKKEIQSTNANKSKFYNIK